MTRRCEHELEIKSNYPEDIICPKCQTIWRIPDYLTWTARDLITLPGEVRSAVLRWQVERFNKENPDYYKKVLADKKTANRSCSFTYADSMWANNKY